MVSVGMAGAVYQGIEYAAIPAVLSLLDIPRADRAEMFALLRLMEAKALGALNAPKDSDG